MQTKKQEQKSKVLINKIICIISIVTILIGNVSMVFAEEDSLANYNQLDYIQTGDNCYIDPQIALFNVTNWKIEMSFNYQSISSGFNLFFGTSRANNPTYYESWTGSDGWYKTRFNNQNQNTQFYFQNSTDYDLIVENTSTNMFVTVNGTSQTLNKINGTDSNNTWIFHRNNGSYFKGKVYFVKIWQNDTLLRDLIPVERKSDNVLGFYDKVNNVFYSNAGNGTFISGNYLRYTITTAVDPANSGTVSGAGSYLPYSTQTLTATASTGYVFSRWSDGNTSNPRTITVMQDETYTAVFSPVQSTYTLTVSANPVGSGSVTGGGTYSSGASVTVSASPNTGYEFVNWNDGNTNNPRTVTMNSNITLVANFQLVPDDKILISTSVNPSGSGYVTGGGYYDENESVTLEAIPNTGYIFVDWSDGETDNPRNITVDEEATYIANFELENPPQPVENDSMTLLMLIVTFLLFLFIDRGGVYNG